MPVQAYEPRNYECDCKGHFVCKAKEFSTKTARVHANRGRNSALIFSFQHDVRSAASNKPDALVVVWILKILRNRPKSVGVLWAQLFVYKICFEECPASSAPSDDGRTRRHLREFFAINHLGKLFNILLVTVQMLCCMIKLLHCRIFQIFR